MNFVGRVLVFRISDGKMAVVFVLQRCAVCCHGHGTLLGGGGVTGSVT